MKTPPPWPTALLNIDLVRWAFGAPKLFRYFDVEEHAESFATGHTYISTIEKCRKTEDAIRGDAGEGTLRYVSGTITGKASSPTVQEIGRRIGIRIDDGEAQVWLSANERVSATPDAYVLCLSSACNERLMEKFGPYVVEIETLRFFEKLTYALSMRYELEPEAPLREVTYASRIYAHLDSPPRDIGFIKPDHFREESEVRCIWIPRNHTPVPHVFYAAEVVGLSKRIR